MPATVSAGLALAVPVKPDLLGDRLEAYAKVVPVLRTLRLCHRFGKGPGVHITRIPAEIELAIEALIIKRAQNEDYWSDWVSAFRHYEGRCDPMSHLVDAYSPLNDGVENVEECDTCADGHYMETAACENRCKAKDTDKCWTCSQRRDPDNCMRTCQAKTYQEMNELALDWEWDGHIDGDCEGWEKKIDQNGNFAQYDKVLREHFGLEVFFSPTRIAKEDSDTWPRNINHHWHSDDKLKTTICYLTMAKQFAPSKTYEESEMEMEFGEPVTACTQAVAVDSFGPKGRAKAVKRFGRAMKTLGLKVHLHPSQQHSLAMPNCEDAQDGKVQEEKDGGNKASSSASSWPKLVLLVKHTAF